MSAAPAPTERALQHAGLRVTRQRVTVLGSLAGRSDAVTAQDLYSEFRDAGEGIGLSTVYRTLTSLADAGLLDTFQREGEQAFKLCGDAHHHHLVCEACHRVVEIEANLVEEWVERVGRSHGFAVTGHRADVFGICDRCRGATAS